MYEVDDRDRVELLNDVPQSSIGAPIPVILGDEGRIVLAYYLEEASHNWDGSTVRSVKPSEGDEPIAIISFKRVAHMFGPPSDETFSGHPLASRGLTPYATFEVKDSSWIRRLERMNSVHPRHRPELYSKLRHLIFAFHDSTFECVCRSFDIQTTRGSLRSILPQMLDLLQWDQSK